MARGESYQTRGKETSDPLLDVVVGDIVTGAAEGRRVQMGKEREVQSRWFKELFSATSRVNRGGPFSHLVY